MNLSQKTKVAAIQMVSGMNVDENLSVMSRLVERSAGSGAELILLPEYFSFMGKNDFDKLDLAELDISLDNCSKKTQIKNKVQYALSSIAKKSKVWIVGGTCSIKSNEREKIYNSMFVYNDNGEKIVRYDKAHLFKFDNGSESYDEALCSVAGNKAVSVETPAGNTFLAVCYDLRFPEFFRRENVFDKPLDLILISAAFTRTTGKAHWEILLRARAIENQCYVLASAQGGNHDSGRNTWGHSMFVSPWGDIIDECELGNNIIYGTLDKSYLDETRKNLPALEHQRLDIRKEWNVKKQR